MKEYVFDDKVVQMLNKFESLQYVQPSAGWNDLLIERIAMAKPVSTSFLPSRGFVLGVIFVVLINIGFILSSILSTPLKTSNQVDELKVISKELLINPISL
jgi:hypothetical protein